MEFNLNDGNKIPAVGLGCWMGSQGGGQRVYDMCSTAFKVGYRHVDTAAGYANETQVGRAIQNCGLPRSQLYVTTKLGNVSHHRVRDAFDESLNELGCSYIDLFLMHWPQHCDPVTNRYFQPEESPTFVETWRDMEALLETGKVKSLGVSNFSIKNLELLLSKCKVVPVVNQVEMHPCLPQNDLKKYCDEKGILLTAYSPLGRNSMLLLEDPIIGSIATEHNASPGQVLLSWGVQRGTVVIPKTENEHRMISNLQIVSLSSAEMDQINTIHTQPEKHRSLLSFHNPDGTVFGWTYPQLGWSMHKGGIVDEE